MVDQRRILMLPELLFWARDKMTRYELYRMWLAYPIFAYKRSLWREPVGAGAVGALHQARASSNGLSVPG